MKYVNAKKVLPDKLIEEIRKHVEGVYVYIPMSENKRKKWGSETKTKKELNLRNSRIYDSYLKGHDIEEIAENNFLSEKSIRRILLEMRRQMEPKKMMINNIIKQWHIQDEAVQIYKSAWAINDDYVLKEYTNESQLKRNIVMFKTLEMDNIPVPSVITLDNGDNYVEHEGHYYLLSSKLTGQSNLDLTLQTEDWLFNLGVIIADLHIAFKKCQDKISYWNNSMLEEMEGWVTQKLNEYNPDFIDKNAIDDSIKELSSVYHELPKQLIHRDIHLGNFLFDDGQFSGYIDFDLSQSNIRIFDLCYFMLGILSACNEFKVDIKQWFRILSEVVNGYDSKLKLSKEEKKAIPCVMKNIELLFVAYFLGKDDGVMAEDAGKLFNLVLENEEKILNELL